jgi:hypothetical protein
MRRKATLGVGRKGLRAGPSPVNVLIAGKNHPIL